MKKEDEDLSFSDLEGKLCRMQNAMENIQKKNGDGIIFLA